ncbi:MAG TPA: hypothetical protein QGH84_02985 [Rhodospirillales bacterium]|nr:hypothetical protein [Rhodospirillales bacterium]
MAKILDVLGDDHRNMARLFDLLARELNTFKDSGRPDYDLVESILEYFACTIRTYATTPRRI